MQILSALASMAFVLVGALVGIRLLLLARRTRRLPELAVGLALLLIGGIGYPIAIVSGLPDVVAEETGVRLMAFGTVVIDLGFIAIVVFTWSVFRRKEAWARALLGLLSIAYAAHALLLVLAAAEMTSAKQVMTDQIGLTLAGQMLNTISFGWAAFEAYRYWWMLRKRSAIGLGDPVTTNRFLLWAMAGTASLCTNAISWWVIYNGIDFFESPGVQLSIAIISVCSCTGQYLAFLPPKAYLARLQRAA